MKKINAHQIDFAWHMRFCDNRPLAKKLGIQIMDGPICSKKGRVVTAGTRRIDGVVMLPDMFITDDNPEPNYDSVMEVCEAAIEKVKESYPEDEEIYFYALVNCPMQNNGAVNFDLIKKVGVRYATRNT